MTRVNGNVELKPGPLKIIFLWVGWITIFVGASWVFTDNTATPVMIGGAFLLGIVVAGIGHKMPNTRWEGSGKVK